MKYSFFKEEVFEARHQITFIGKEMKIYLPSNYLEEDSVFATRLGNKIETVGLFWFSVDGKFYEMSMPIKMQFEYQEESTFSGKLKPELLSLQYNVFILRAGDAFCYDIFHKVDILDLETMLLKVIDNGKMPQTISYNESLEVMLKLFIAAGVNTKLGVASAIVEIVLSEMYRNKYNVSEPFRKLLNSSKTASEYDFKLVRMSRLSGLNSIFNSVIGEDVYQQMANSIVRNREKIIDRPSPMERLLKY